MTAHGQIPVGSDRMESLHLQLDGTWVQGCRCRLKFAASTASEVRTVFDAHECQPPTATQFITAVLAPDDASLPPNECCPRHRLLCEVTDFQGDACCTDCPDWGTP